MLARVFPEKNSFTPTDKYAYIGDPPITPLPRDIHEVHVSVVFSWHIAEGERLRHAWTVRLRQEGLDVPVLIGGPAFNTPGGEFMPGRYVKEGVVVTSRGCQNKCWFCSVWRREGGLRELPIMEGWEVLDDNLLACSEEHIRAVFQMLKQQPRRAEFTGGLEAKLLEFWHIDLLEDLHPRQMFFAYDTPDDLPHLFRAREMMGDRWSRHTLYCYVLIGYPQDTMEDAEERLVQVKDLGFTPFAMLYRDSDGGVDKPWKKYQRMWCRPGCIFARDWEPPLQRLREKE